MKKLLIISLLLLTVMIFNFVSCNNDNSEKPTEAPDKIETPSSEDGATAEEAPSNNGTELLPETEKPVLQIEGDYNEFVTFVQTGKLNSQKYGSDREYFEKYFKLNDGVFVDVKSLFELAPLSDKHTEMVIIEEPNGFRYSVFTPDVLEYSISVTLSKSNENSSNISNNSNVANVNPYESLNSKTEGLFVLESGDNKALYTKYNNLYQSLNISYGNRNINISFVEGAKNAAEIRSRCGDKIASLFSGDAKLAEATMSEIVNDLK